MNDQHTLTADVLDRPPRSRRTAFIDAALAAAGNGGAGAASQHPHAAPAGSELGARRQAAIA